MIKMQLLHDQLYSVYLQNQKVNIPYYFFKIKKIDLSVSSFNFYNAISVMASSKIEGEVMDIDSYVRHKTANVKYNASLVQKPNDLFKAYEFAQQNKLSKITILKAHKLISKNLLHTLWQGKIRNSDMVIRDKNKIIYEACSKENVAIEFDRLFKDVAVLLKQQLSTNETFFFASLIHLMFVNIHPFDDGNGRLARLLEKWFLAEKLGANAWFIQTDLYYWNNRNSFYKNLNKLGLFYENIDYTKAYDFLQMLPKSLK